MSQSKVDENKPKTIADLGQKPASEKTIVGRSMISDSRKALEQRIRDLEEKRKLEDAVLEAAGYDYGGNEQWLEAMRNVGRR